MSTSPRLGGLRGGTDQDLVDVDPVRLRDRVGDRGGDVVRLEGAGGPVVEERGVVAILHAFGC